MYVIKKTKYDRIINKNSRNRRSVTRRPPICTLAESKQPQVFRRRGRTRYSNRTISHILRTRGFINILFETLIRIHSLQTAVGRKSPWELIRAAEDH